MNPEPILVRLLGALLGRGTFSGGDHPHVRFSIPNRGASELLEDLSRLDASPSVRRGKRWTSVKSRDCNLLGALVLIGASPDPVGRVPGWVFEDSYAARELLSGLYSVRGEVLGFDGNRPRPVRLELRARADRERELLLLALDVCRLLELLGVGAEVVGLSPISAKCYRYTRVGVLIHGRRDLRRFLSEVRFRYNTEQSERARRVLDRLTRCETRFSTRWPTRWGGVSIPDSGDEGLILRTELGFEIAGPVNMRVPTPRGERQLGDLKPGDRIASYPVEVPPTIDRWGVLVRSLDVPDGASRFLQDLNLLPLKWEDPALPTLARVLGYAIGDGHLEPDVVKFYGEPKGLQWLEGDLRALGLSPVRYEYGNRDAVEVAVHSEGFARLLEELGAPIGRKTGRVRVPGWISRGPDRVILEFLSGLFGADGYVFTSESKVQIGLTQASLTGDPPGLLEDVRAMINGLGTTVRMYRMRSYETSEGEQRWLFDLRAHGRQSERFLIRIPFEYSVRKRERGLWAGAYLRYRARSGEDAFERFVEDRCLPSGLVLDRVVNIEHR